MCMVMVCHPSYLECLKITLSANIVTMIFRDDVPFISQLKRWHIKGDKTKYISPKFFYTLEIRILISSKYASQIIFLMFTKALPTSMFQEIVYGISMHHLNKLLS